MEETVGTEYEELVKHFSHREKVRKKKEQLRTFRKGGHNNRWRQMEYDLHKVRLEKVKAFIDTKKPLVPTGVRASIHSNLSLQKERCYHVQRENSRLISSLTNIISRPSSISLYIRNKPPDIVKSPMTAKEKRESVDVKIVKENVDLWKRINATKSMYSTKKIMKDYKVLEEKMEALSYYPLYWRDEVRPTTHFTDGEVIVKTPKVSNLPCSIPRTPVSQKACAQALQNPNPLVYMDLATNRKKIGEYGMTYEKSVIHKVIPEIWWEGGKFLRSNPTSSIYGDYFPDESFQLKHSEPGILSMVNFGPNTNGTEFFITAKALPALDGVNVAFGKVIDGLPILNKITRVAGTYQPKHKVWVYRCGELSDTNLSGEGDESSSEILSSSAAPVCQEIEFPTIPGKELIFPRGINNYYKGDFKGLPKLNNEDMSGARRRRPKPAANDEEKSTSKLPNCEVRTVQEGNDEQHGYNADDEEDTGGGGDLKTKFCFQPKSPTN